VCWATETVIWKAQRASRASVVGLPAVNYINRREMGNDTNEKPLNAMQKGTTMIKYSTAWTQIVRYIWRTHMLEEVKAGNGDRQQETDGEEEDREEEVEGKGIKGKKPGYRFTIQQATRLWKIKEIVGEVEEEVNEGEGNEEESEDEGEDEENEEEQERLKDRVLVFLLALLDHNLKDNEYRSAFVSASAVLGVDDSCG
jgi:hypothetical protein